MRIFCFILFVLLSIQSVGQNWMFLNTEDRYHFQHDNDSIPLNTVLVDSVQEDSNMQVYYLNRLFLLCDTCSVEIDEWGDTINFYLDNQPTFLQREVHFYQASNTVVLFDPDEYTIKLPGSAETEWYFDKDETQLATNADIRVENWFGVSDSVVTININDEAQIKIGKTLGLLKYFEYTLSGLEYARLGKCLPGFWEFYDFQVGDVFVYNKDVLEEGADHPIYSEVLFKEIVQNVSKSGDTLKVDFLVYERELWYPPETACDHYTSKSIYINNGKHYANTYPNQRIPYCNYYNDDYIQECYDYENDYNRELCSFASVNICDNGIQKIVGGNLMGYGNPSFQRGDSTRIFKEVDSFFSIYNLYKEGLGIVDYHYFGGEDGYGYEMLGYVKGVDTVGTVYSDSFMLDIKKSEICQEFIIYPNPSKGKLSFSFEMPGKAEVKIYSSQGQQILSFQTVSNQTHSLSHLNPGIYIISVQLGEKLEQLKWIKQ